MPLINDFSFSSQLLNYHSPVRHWWGDTEGVERSQRGILMADELWTQALTSRFLKMTPLLRQVQWLKQMSFTEGSTRRSTRRFTRHIDAAACFITCVRLFIRKLRRWSDNSVYINAAVQNGPWQSCLWWETAAFLSQRVILTQCHSHYLPCHAISNQCLRSPSCWYHCRWHQSYQLRSSNLPSSFSQWLRSAHCALWLLCVQKWEEVWKWCQSVSGTRLGGLYEYITQYILR